MNSEQKLNLDLDLINKFRSMTEEECLSEFSLYIGANKPDDRLSILMKGNIVMGANVICEKMDEDPVFRQFLMSLMGAYLAKNPEHDVDFQKGLEALKNNQKSKKG